MSRKEVLARMKMRTPKQAESRIIIVTDAKNEADDQFMIMHHLLMPTSDVRGIVGSHFESKAKIPGETMEKSYQEIVKLLELAEMEDVPAFRGCTRPLENENDAPKSDGVDFIIEEALKQDARPLYVAVTGTMTDVAAAINRCPEIAKNMIVLWNGGNGYPNGGSEFNLKQDIDACRVVLKSECQVWQTPLTCYGALEVSFAEIALNVRPCAKIGQYLYDQLEEYQLACYDEEQPLRRGEEWCIGDQPTISVLLSTVFRGNFHTEKAPLINDDMTYTYDANGKDIRVYDYVDVRLTISDFFSKMKLAYGNN